MSDGYPVPLQLGDHTVELARDGAEGLTRAHLQARRRALRSRPPRHGRVRRGDASRPVLTDTVLIALSGYTRPDDVRRAIAAGFDRHIAKPPDLERLADLLRSPDCGRA